MTYEQMCQWVVKSQGFEWDDFIKKNADRREEYVETRNICFYFGWKYYKSLSYSKMGRTFGKDHSTVMHSIKIVKRDINTVGDFSRKMKAYDRHITEALSTYRLKEDDSDGSMTSLLLTSIEQMRLVAEAYCRITGKKII